MMGLTGQVPIYPCEGWGYRDERLHSALKYLRLTDYHRDNPQALLAE